MYLQGERARNFLKLCMCKICVCVCVCVGMRACVCFGNLKVGWIFLLECLII